MSQRIDAVPFYTQYKCENRNVIATYKSFHDDQNGFRFNIYSQQSEFLYWQVGPLELLIQ